MSFSAKFFFYSRDVLKHIKQKNLQPVPQVADPVITPPSAAQAPPTPTVIDTPPKPLPSPVMSDRQTPPSSGAAYEDYDLTSMRQVIAKRLTESKVSLILMFVIYIRVQPNNTILGFS